MNVTRVDPAVQDKRKDGATEFIWFLAILGIALLAAVIFLTYESLRFIEVFLFLLMILTFSSPSPKALSYHVQIIQFNFFCRALLIGCSGFVYHGVFGLLKILLSGLFFAG